MSPVELKGDVTVTCAELTTTNDGPSLDIVAKLTHSCNGQSVGRRSSNYVSGGEFLKGAFAG